MRSLLTTRGATVGLRLSLFLVAAVLSAACQKPIAWSGQAFETPVYPPELALVDQKGEAFQWKRLRGRVVLVNFGYSRCPDICPLTLSRMRNVLKAMGQQATDVSVVWVTIDPDRDRPEFIDRYLRLFHDNFIGVTGDPRELRTLADTFGVFYKRVSYDGNMEGYAFQHSTAVFILDREGRIRVIHKDTSDTRKLIRDIRHLL